MKVIPAGSADAIAQALIRVPSQRELRESLSALSCERAQDFGIDATALADWHLASKLYVYHDNDGKITKIERS